MHDAGTSRGKAWQLAHFHEILNGHCTTQKIFNRLAPLDRKWIFLGCDANRFSKIWGDGRPFSKYHVYTSTLVVNVLHACLEMPRRSLRALRNLQGYATHNTRKTTLQKIRRIQPLTIPIPKGKENRAQALFCHIHIWFLCVNEEHCERHGFLIQILPKYHCELNPLEMVWGRSKFYYQLNPPSKKEEDLHQNVINALEAVTLTEMWRYLIF